MYAISCMSDYVLGGYYTDEDPHFTSGNIVQFTDWIFSNIELKKGNHAIFDMWQSAKYSPDGSLDFNLLYYSVCSLLDNIDFETCEESQRNSIFRYAKDVLNVIAVSEKKNPVFDGGTRYWFRLGNILCNLGQYHNALEVYNEGISILKRLSNWKSGELIGTEREFGLQFSMIEWLYAARGRCEFKLNQKDRAKESIKIVLDSIKLRGFYDLIDKHFPRGIRRYLIN